ncbi:uncharacterized protein METZ01_LOCUS305099 [marine metagenome]|jgi:hypothetical protein|uniref:DUF1232 domain-containing protein n=1 Tax=marine metagenome TaxID=408172 RepID=A0A382MVU8_9ZZZZ|tara:strand:- start:1097 stop:1483 length:387 start_codon:yes stop_codon:yes gene_type:complete
MNISNLFQLTEEDKDQYRKLIDKIDLDSSDDIISMLSPKLDRLVASDGLNDIEIDLIKNVSVLVSIYQTYPDLTDSIRRRILFAISYFCDEDDDIPDIVPDIGYLDDAVIANWVIESISKDLPEVSKA